MSARQKVSDLFTAYGSRSAPIKGTQMRIDAVLVWELLLEAENGGASEQDILLPYKQQIELLQTRLKAANAKIASLLGQITELEEQKRPIMVSAPIASPSPIPPPKPTVPPPATVKSSPTPTMVIGRDAEFRNNIHINSKDKSLYGKAYTAFLNGEISWLTFQAVAEKFKLMHFPLPDES